MRIRSRDAVRFHKKRSHLYERNCSPCWERTRNDRDDPLGTESRGVTVSISKLCRWFEVPRRTVYYRATRKPPAVQDRYHQPIKQMIEENPSFGYRTVARLLNFNKNSVRRVFQLLRWQVKKTACGLATSSTGYALQGRGSE